MSEANYISRNWSLGSSGFSVWCGDKKLATVTGSLPTHEKKKITCLILAAPDLLEVAEFAEMVLTQLGRDRNLEQLDRYLSGLDTIRSYIAKAKGGAPLARRSIRQHRGVIAKPPMANANVG